MNLSYPLILASNSPRRKELLEQAGFTFKVVSRSVAENYPKHLSPEQVALFIAFQKMSVYEDLILHNIVICADTIVVFENEILGKPKNDKEAVAMLGKLSGQSHEVITGVAISGPNIQKSFTSTTVVQFDALSDEEISYYVEKFNPVDKAGSYGIQEWIGLIGIKEIHGSYFNVVGLPVSRIYEELKEYRF